MTKQIHLFKNLSLIFLRYIGMNDCILLLDLLYKKEREGLLSLIQCNFNFIFYSKIQSFFDFICKIVVE